MKKRSLGAAAAAVLASFGILASTAASGAVLSSTPGSVTPTQQLTSTSTTIPVQGDFDGDGRDDVFWYVPGSGADYLWSGKVRDDTSSTTIADRFDVTTLPITGSYTPVVGDFNGDGRDDILWYSPGPGPDSVWYFTGRGTVRGVDLTIGGTYQARVSDFDATDGIGADDIFWYNNSASYLWTANANETFTSAAIANPPDNAKVYVGNFRQTAVSQGAKEYEDLFFYVAGTAPDSIWAGNGDGGFTPNAVTVNGTYDPIVGNFDSNASGVDMTDIFWYGPGAAADSVWMNNGTSFTSQPQTVNGRYAPVVVPSREATTQDDIFWDSKTAGDFLWATNGTNGTFAYTSMTPSAWGGSDIGQRTALPGDYNIADATNTSGSSAFSDLTAGAAHHCAITSDRGVECWGYNNFGNLGNGTTTNSSIPVAVTGLSSGVSSVDSSNHHTCAINSSGGVRCWGYNGFAQLGDGTTTNRTTPVGPASLTSGVASVAASEFHTCARLANGTVSCWGRNNVGQLGNGTTTDSTTPVAVTGLTGVTQLDGGASSSTCAVSAGAAKCWGLNNGGQLGNGTTTNSSTPVTVTGLTSGVAKVVVGSSHACALTTTGAVKCWGVNNSGQLGNGTATNSTTPVNVTGLSSGVADISVGIAVSCATLTDGTVRCWGENPYGNLGVGYAGNPSVPTAFVGLTGTASIASTNAYTTCVLKTNGGIQCVGYGTFGNRGDGTTAGSLTPTEVAGGFSFGGFTRPKGNADVLWYTPGNATGETEVLWYDLDSLN